MKNDPTINNNDNIIFKKVENLMKARWAAGKEA